MPGRAVRPMRRTGVAIVILACLFVIPIQALMAASVVHSNAGLGQKQALSSDQSPLANGHSVWIGALDSIPNSLSDKKNLSAIFEQWESIGVTEIRPLPDPDSETEGYFSATHNYSGTLPAGTKMYWLILESTGDSPQAFTPGSPINLETIAGFGLFSGSGDAWNLPDSGMPIPFNSTRLDSDSVDEAYFGSIEALGLALKKSSIQEDALEPVPSGFVSQDIPWPAQEDLPVHILAFDSSGQSGSDLIRLETVASDPGGVETTSLIIQPGDTAISRELHIIACVSEVENDSILLAGMDIDFEIPETYFSSLSRADENSGLTLSFQAIDYPSPHYINSESWTPMTVVLDESGMAEQGAIKVKARSTFSNIMRTDPEGNAWIAFKLVFPESFIEPITWHQLKLHVLKVQNQTRVSKIFQSEDGKSIILSLKVESGIPVIIQTSEDLLLWGDLISLPTDSEQIDLELRVDGLPDFTVFRAWQELNLPQ